VRRMELPGLSWTSAGVVAGVAACALALTLVAGSDAKGKKKGKGPKGAVVTNTTQSEIVDAGAVRLSGVKGKVVVQATSGGKVVAPVATYNSKKGKKKGKSAVAAKAATVQLSEQGKSVLAACSFDALNAKTILKGGKKKRTRNRSTAIDRDLGVCSVGSENPTPKPYKGPPIATDNSDRCDFLDPAVCLQPWPNDYFTVADGDTDTGRRLNLNQESMPRNRFNVPITNTDYNRGDGFSPGNMIVLKVPEVQTQAAFDNSGIVSAQNLSAYDDPGQPIVVIDADTGERHPIWAGVDTNPLQQPIPGVTGGGSQNPGDSNLIIHPARNFEEGHRYIVAVRSLRNASNAAVEPPIPFRVYRDRLITQQAPVESRREHIEDLIGDLQGSGIQRANLYMAWDFTVASEDSLTGRALEMRDDALLRLGDTTAGDPIDGDETGDDTPGDGSIDGDAPQFNIPNGPPAVDGAPGVTNFAPCGGDGCQAGESDTMLRQVVGTLTNVPCYLSTAGCGTGTQFGFAPGEDDPILAPSSFADDPDRDYDGVGGANPPVHTDGVDFRCIIPRSVVDGTEVDPAKPGTYGHGLLGLYTQVNGQARLGNQSNSIWCAVNWAGFSSDDAAPVAGALTNLSTFNRLVDRMQQGFVNFHYLGRALVNADGFNSSDAFKVDADGSTTLDPDESVIDTSELYFEGISQGAIMGGALTALSPDFERSVLNVNGMNYSSLLRRSVDFDEYAEAATIGLYDSYPNELERPLILSMIQLLWDRGEANGYAHHMTDDPLANTPEHTVLLQAAVGDHQVANITAEVEARTIGASIHNPGVYPGRHWQSNPFTEIPSIPFGAGPTFTPFEGSALVYYDGGPVSFFNDGVGEAVVECTNNPNSTVPLTGGSICQGSGVAPADEVPPRPQLGYGEDPHAYPRRSVDALGHIQTFLDPDGFILPCTDPGPVIRPCHANGWTGP
jgi:hypothetical protein